jgi:transposase
MSSTPDPSSGEETARSPIALIRDLQSGALQARSLSKDSRRACIEHLAAEGWSIAEMAEVLKVSGRTVHRDVAAIREANAVEADERTTAVMVGRLLTQADHSIGRLRRIARERDCESAVRVEAERSAWTIMRELFETLQRVGYVPTAPQQLEAAVLHRHEDAPSAAELEEQARRLLLILKESGDTSSDTLEQLTTLQDSFARSAAAESLAILRKSLPASTQSKEIDDDQPSE